MGRQLVLASTSPYRAELLGRLGLAFERTAPEQDETRDTTESPEDYVRRLAEGKAHSVIARYPEALVIGSDQTVVGVDGATVGKPGTPEGARAQLRAASGHTLTFLTAVTLLDALSGRYATEVVPFAVTFRDLDDHEIERYVDHDRPFDCAGAIRSEGMAPALFQRTDGEDPTALIGLPLIRTAALLRAFGVPVP